MLRTLILAAACAALLNGTASAAVFMVDVSWAVEDAARHPFDVAFAPAVADAQALLEIPWASPTLNAGTGFGPGVDEALSAFTPAAAPL